MEVVFIKNFTQQLTFHLLGDIKKTITLNSFSLDEIIFEVGKEVEEKDIVKVTLVGQAGILKELEKYYMDKGVLIEWL